MHTVCYGLGVQDLIFLSPYLLFSLHSTYLRIFSSFWLSPSNDQVNAVKSYEHLINGQCDGHIANVPSLSLQI